MNSTAVSAALRLDLAPAPAQDVSPARNDEAMFRQLLEVSTDAVVTMHADGHVATWNRGAEAMFGWKTDEAIGRCLSELVIPPQDATQDGSDFQSIHHPTLQYKQVELTALCKNGRLLPIELTVWPIQLEGRTLFGTFIRDISARRIAENALRNSEQRLRQVIDNASEGILVVQAGRIVFANPRIEHLTCRGLDELRSMAFAETVHADDRAALLDHYQRSLRGQHVEPRFRFRLCDPAGRATWVEISAVVIEWDGRPATLSFVTDITDRKHLEDSLTQNLAERETILQNSIIGIAFLSPEGRVQWSNRAMMQIFRGKEINYSGHALDKYFPTREAYLKMGAAVNDAAVRGLVFETEQKMRRSDGSWFWAYLCGRAVNAGNLSQGTVWVSMDITARKELEESLHLAKEQYQSVVDNVTEGMTVVQEGKFIFANPAFLSLLGYTAEEIIGSDFRHTVHADDLPVVLENHQRRLRGEMTEPKYDFRALCKDGTPMWVQVSAVLVDWHGSPATIAFMSDITRRKQAEEDIRASLERQRELNLLKSRFVAMTSHEFRTPLTTILSSSELLRYYGEKMPASERAEVIASIDTAVRRMTKMLDDVLLIGKVEAEKLAFQPGPLRLDAFCEACLQEARALVATQPGAAIDLQLQMRGCEASVVLDEALMHHILGNLLSNAIKYSPKGGTVRIDVACNRADIEISVADSGIGMSAQDLPHLFETFYRASNVGNVAGTGLGLAIVKHAVELHGGRIDVGSTPGIGTRFVVSLPRVRDTQTSPDAQP